MNKPIDLPQYATSTTDRNLPFVVSHGKRKLIQTPTVQLMNSILKSLRSEFLNTRLFCKERKLEHAIQHTGVQLTLHLLFYRSQPTRRFAQNTSSSENTNTYARCGSQMHILMTEMRMRSLVWIFLHYRSSNVKIHILLT